MPSGEQTDQADDSHKLATELVQSGGAIAGSVAGAAIGLIGGPVGVLGGAAAGAVIGRVLQLVGAEIQRRILAPREQARIGAALAFAATRIHQRLDAGDLPREDRFFAASTERGRRPPSEETLEGVLLKSRDAYEEQKVQLFGNLYANVVFDEDISPTYASYLIKLAGELTYNQLVALAVAQDTSKKAHLRDRNYRDDAAALEALGANGIGLLSEIYDLHQRGLVVGSDNVAWLCIEDVTGNFDVQNAGKVLAQLMDLATSIPPEDREIFYSTLSA